MQLTLISRDRHTSNILEEARGYGWLDSDGRVIVVSRLNDPLAQPEDQGPFATREELFQLLHDHSTPISEVLIIANGGTTQMIPIIASLSAWAQRWDDGANEFLRFTGRPWRWRVVEVQPDGVQLLAGAPKHRSLGFKE